MIIEDQSYEIERWEPEEDLKLICKAARICYKSPEMADRKAMEDFIQKLRTSDPEHPHHSPLEHSLLSVRFITNRGISHEIVRHRLIAVNQESTRYCNYTKDRWDSNVHFIRDTSIKEGPEYDAWLEDCRKCEEQYFNRIASRECRLDQARGVLNNDVKTELIVTTNYREWLHILNLRCDKKHAHYQMVELMTPLLNELKAELPCVFGDLYNEDAKSPKQHIMYEHQYSDGLDLYFCECGVMVSQDDVFCRKCGKRFTDTKIIIK